MSRAWFALAAAMMAAGFAPPPKEREETLPPATEAEWKASAVKLKEIGIAFHNYESTFGYFPGDVRDAAGKPLLSWRVAILPYIEADDVYKQFKLDEAWDGPTNKPLLEKMPKLFAPVRVKAKAGVTFFQGFAGPDTAFDPKLKRLTVAHFTDGMSNSCLVAEAGVAVEWTKPADIPFDPKTDLPKLGGHFGGAFNMLLADGSVMAVRKDFHAETMKNAVTRNDGTVINLEMIRR